MTANEASTLDPEQVTFGQYLKKLRLDQNLTQLELAEQAGVSERLISDYERGMIHRPRRDTAQLLANGLRLADTDRLRFIDVARGRENQGRDSASAVRQIACALPAPATRLVGREADMAAASTLLSDEACRLLTLTGPGGVGKTRLAIELGHVMAPDFPDGARFVDLAPLRDPDLVLVRVARMLGVKPLTSQPLIDRLTEVLRDQSLLLILDNFEHLLPAAPSIAELLRRCDQMTVLVTSRALLHVQAEHHFAVEPLDLPNLDELPSFEALAQIPAIELFVSRAIAANHSFALTSDNARAVAEIAVRLDGLPLAIELAVARLAVLSPELLLERLEHRLPILTGGPRDLPDRLQALRAAIDWSFELLEPYEQALYCRLSVFVGGFTLEAAEFAGADFPVLDGLTSLVHKSLVQVAKDAAGNRRFSMLETIREFGLERLDQSGEHDDARASHMQWCLTFVEAAARDEYRFEQPHWLDLLDTELDNIRAALAWAVDNRFTDAAERICCACRDYWVHRGLLDEGRRWLERVLRLNGDVSLAVRANTLLALGDVAYVQGDYERASVLHDALAQFEAVGDRTGVAITLRAMGRLAQDTNEFTRALDLHERSLALFRELGDQVQVARLLVSLGLAAHDAGDNERAVVLLEEGLALSRELGIGQCTASALNNLALVAIANQEYDRATALQQEALADWQALGYKVGIAHSFENLAIVAVHTGNLERALVLFGASETVRMLAGTPGRLVDRQQNARLIAGVRSEVGESAFLRAREAGRALSTEAAIDFALEIADDSPLDLPGTQTSRTG